jgi:hypothetical protein
MFIIDGTYFIRNYNIPNANELQTGSSIQLMQYIDERVPFVLKQALGFELFKDLTDNMTDGILNADAEQRWKDLVNGKTYEKNSKEYRWNGLAYTEGTFKNSLLTPFVYYHYLKDHVSQLSGVGEVAGTAKNAESVNSNQRLVNAWNDFILQYQGACRNKPLRYYKDLVLVTDYYGGKDNSFVDLLTFLQDNQTDYPDAPLTRYELQNSFGL